MTQNDRSLGQFARPGKFLLPATELTHVWLWVEQYSSHISRPSENVQDSHDLLGDFKPIKARSQTVKAKARCLWCSSRSQSKCQGFKSGMRQCGRKTDRQVGLRCAPVARIRAISREPTCSGADTRSTPPFRTGYCSRMGRKERGLATVLELREHTATQSDAPCDLRAAASLLGCCKASRNHEMAGSF